MADFTIDVWDGPQMNKIVETLARATHAEIARAAFDAACKVRPQGTITLRQGAMHIASHNGPCETCDGTGWVCENHPAKPWKVVSGRNDACECGAGMRCPTCNTGPEVKVPPGFKLATGGEEPN